MIKVAQVILKLSKIYPDHTFFIFQDIIDILIAWHIDVTQTDELINTISDILVDFRPFWLKEINFTINLLYQFVEDLESYLSVRNQSPIFFKLKIMILIFLF